MTKKRKANSNRYDLPGSRILIRSLRHCEKRIESITADRPDPLEREAARDAVLRMVRDLFVVRLLEDRRVVVDRYLCGGKRSRRLEKEAAVEKLTALNQWLGSPVFEIPAWSDYDPGEELAQLDHELHLSRFWPPGMPVETLGALWEERLPVPKRNGVFYTPRSIVETLLDGVFQGLFPRKESSKPAMLDPACGSGYFLLGAFRRLAAPELAAHRAKGNLFAPVLRGESGQTVLDPARRMEIISDHLFGVDLDEGAVSLARRALLIEVLGDVAAFRRPAPSLGPLYHNLRVGDAILEKGFPQQVDLFEPDNPPPLKPMDWWDDNEGFGNILSRGGFDCVFGNPPWVSLKGRHRQAPYSQEVVDYLTRRYKADTYRPNIVEFFIRRALELLAEDGWNSFVVPDRIAENEQYDSLRRYMAARGEMVSLHFREPFPGVAADTLIYLYNKRKRPRRSQRIVLSDASGVKRDAPQSYWVRGESGLAGEDKSDEIEAILKKIESAGRRSLSDFLETGVGFIARPGRITPTSSHEGQSPVIKGEHVSPYKREGSAWFEFTLQNLAGGTRNVAKLTRKERILLRKTGARLVATIDPSGHMPEQSLYFAFPRERRLARAYDLRFFLGILNSRLMSFYFRNRKITNRSTTPQIKKIHLDSLPIRPVNFQDPGSKAIHDRLVSAVEKRESAAGSAETRALDDEIDEVVAELFGLSERELEKVRSETDKGWG